MQRKAHKQPLTKLTNVRSTHDVSWIDQKKRVRVKEEEEEEEKM